jgi:GTP-binding protein HflX
MPFLMSDTVGFIRKLPHHLVESFKSTLDEVRESDLLLHVVDISHPQYEDQIGIVKKTLHEINAFDKPVIYVFNKMDRYEELNFDQWLEETTKEELLRELKERWEQETQSPCVFMSATERSNVDGLREILISRVKDLYKERFPYKTEFLF